MKSTPLPIRRLVLDVDKATAKPSLLEIAAGIGTVPGVEALNITVTEIDVETIGMDITIEGTGLDHAAIVSAIEATGAVVHSVDQVVAGNRLVERIVRAR
jgi:hypothetical protein